MSSRMCLSPRMTLAGVAIGLFTAATMLLAEQNPADQTQTAGPAAARTRPLNADAVLHSAIQRELHAATQRSGASAPGTNGDSAREASKGWTRTSVRSQSPTEHHEALQSMFVTRTQQSAATSRQDADQHTWRSTAQPVIQLAAAETPAHDEHRAPSAAKSDVARKLEQFYSRNSGSAAETTNSLAPAESTEHADHVAPAGGPAERITPPAVPKPPASPPLLQRLLPFGNRPAQQTSRPGTQGGDTASSHPSRTGRHLQHPHHRATANRRSDDTTRSPQATENTRPGLLPDFNLFERLQDSLPKPIAIQRSAPQPPLPSQTKTAATQEPQTIPAILEPEPDPISQPDPAPAATNNLVDLGNPFPEMSEDEADLLRKSPFTGLKLTDQDLNSVSEPEPSPAEAQEQKVAEARPQKPAEQPTLAEQHKPIEPSPSQTQRPSIPAEQPRLAQKQIPTERSHSAAAQETKPAAEFKPARHIPADLLNLARRNTQTSTPKPERPEPSKPTAPAAPIEEPTFADNAKSTLEPKPESTPAESIEPTFAQRRSPQLERQPAEQTAPAATAEPTPHSHLAQESKPAPQASTDRHQRFIQRTIISAQPRIEPRHEQPIKHATPPNDEVPPEPKATQVAATQATSEPEPNDEPSDVSQYDRNSKMARIAERDGQAGFKGFCPVALRDRRDLIDADTKFASQFETRTYAFSSAEAKTKFDADPEKYAPAAAGYDVILLIKGEAVEGSLDNAVWFRDRLYLFSSRETLQQFTAEPAENSASH